jgi:KDO2-lipid IV(A) lauroyltransferase
MLFRADILTPRLKARKEKPQSKIFANLLSVRRESFVRYTTRLNFAMAEHENIRTNLEHWAARTVVGCFSLLPLRAAINLGRAIGRLGSWFSKLRRTGERNLELAFPDLSVQDRRKLLRGCFENLGRLLGVFSHFEKETIDAWREVIDCEGLDQLAAARAEGRAIILFTGHVGAWELTSFALSLFDQPLRFLVRRIDNPRIEQFVDRYRTCHGNRTIDKRFAAREMLQLLQNGGTLGILVDLNTLDREAVFVDFFGIKAATTFLVAKLALRTGAAVIPIFAPWDKARNKFVLKIDKPLSFEKSDNEEENVVELTQMLTNVVESYVRLYPDQWLWIHRRWKTRPPGERPIYN